MGLTKLLESGNLSLTRFGKFLDIVQIFFLSCILSPLFQGLCYYIWDFLILLQWFLMLCSLFSTFFFFFFLFFRLGNFNWSATHLTVPSVIIILLLITSRKFIYLFFSPVFPFTLFLKIFSVSLLRFLTFILNPNPLSHWTQNSCLKPLSKNYSVCVTWGLVPTDCLSLEVGSRFPGCSYTV